MVGHGEATGLGDGMHRVVAVIGGVSRVAMEAPLAGRLAMALNIIRWTADAMGQAEGFDRSELAGALLWTCREFDRPQPINLPRIVGDPPRAVAGDEFRSVGDDALMILAETAFEAASLIAAVAAEPHDSEREGGLPMRWILVLVTVFDACGPIWRDQLAEIAARVLLDPAFPPNGFAIPDEIRPGQFNSTSPELDAISLRTPGTIH